MRTLVSGLTHDLQISVTRGVRSCWLRGKNGSTTRPATKPPACRWARLPRRLRL